MYRWNQHLDQSSHCQKPSQTINQLLPTILKVSRHLQRFYQQIHNSRIIHDHVDVEPLLSGIVICRIHRKYQSAGEKGDRQNQQIQNFCSRRNFHPPGHTLGTFQRISQTNWDNRCQAESEIVGHHIQPAQPDRSVIHQHGNHLQNGDSTNQNKRGKKPFCLFGIQGFA